MIRIPIAVWTLVKAAGYAGVSAILGYASWRAVIDQNVRFGRNYGLDRGYAASEHPVVFWGAVSASSLFACGFALACLLLVYSLIRPCGGRRVDPDQR